MNCHEFRAAILDMDGVITQTAKVHARAWKRMFDDYLDNRNEQKDESHAPFDIDHDYREYVDGKPRYAGVKSFLDSRGIVLPYGEDSDEPNRETICGLGNRKNELLHELLDRDGVETYEDTLEQIGHWKHDGVKVAVISSSRNCEAVLKAANVLELFDAKVDGNDLAREHLQGKPAPDMFLHAARLLGVDPKRAIVVEDAIAGVQAGRDGGFGLVVGVARDGNAEDLRQAGADCVVHDLRELQKRIHCPPGEDLLQTPSSAMEHWDWIAHRIEGKEMALFLDYDGTLTPIVRRPEEATLSETMRALLTDLSKHCTLAIVSGRDRRNVEEMVQVENLIYAGSHGFDIHGPDGLDMQQQDAQKALPDLDEAERQLRPPIDAIPGARVERKKYAIAVHYREVSGQENLRRVEEIVDEVARKRPQLRKRGGKKIFELQPDVDWDKGRAILWIMNALGLDPSKMVLYLGDDVTDEDAFKVLYLRGLGLGIRVALPTEGTYAPYYLRDCGEVQNFLQSLLTILKQNSAGSP